MSNKQTASMEKIMDLQEAIVYLEDLVTSLKVGRIEVAEGEKRVILCPPNTLEVEVDAKIKKDKQKFVLELSWKNELEKIGGSSGKESCPNCDAGECTSNCISDSDMKES